MEPAKDQAGRKQGLSCDHAGPRRGIAPAERSAASWPGRRRSIAGASGGLTAVFALVALIGAVPTSADECDALNGGDTGTCFVPPAGAAETPDVTTALHFPGHANVPFDRAYPNFKATVSSIVHDSATVGGTTNGTPTGSVEFRQYESGDCSGTAADTETVAVGGGFADQTHSFGPITQPTTLSFQASYTSDDASKWTNATSACEKLSVVCQSRSRACGPAPATST